MEDLRGKMECMGHKMDDEQFMIFSYGAKELPVILLMAGALSTVSSGQIAKSLKNGADAGALTKLKNESIKLMHLFFIPSMLLFFFSDEIFGFVFNKTFGESGPVFNIYLLLVIPRLLFPQAVLRGHLKNTVLP